EHSYRRHFFETEPNVIPTADLAGLVAYSTGHLTSRSGDPFPIIYDQDGGGVLLTEMRYDASEIIASTIRLEQAYEDGVSNLLENVVLYGDCAQLMPAGSKVLIISDRGSSETIENILTENGYNLRVVTSERIGNLSLVEYYKIIIPSDQPFDLYDRLTDNKDWITDWFDSVAPYSGKVFEFHGACQPDDSWTSLSMLGGLKCSDLNGAEFGEFAFGGYPSLKEAISEPTLLWERRDMGEDGRSPFSEEDNALIRVGKWVNKVVPVLARSATGRGIQANQIAVLHNGNCGENQDILCAAARACLIPVCCIDLHGEDHVWNEFYDDGWHFYETWRGGVMTTLGGKGTGVLDLDYGGRYPFSGTLRWRNDGLVEVNTDFYSNTCDFQLKLRDGNGVPIDGALVEVWAACVLAGSYPDYMRSVWGHTRPDGTLTLKLGNTRELYARIESSLGEYPDPSDGDLELISSYSQTGQTYSWEKSLPGEMPSLDVAQIQPPISDGSKLSITFELPYQTLYCENPMDYNVAAEKLTPGQIDFFICDADNFAKLEGGERAEVFSQLNDVEESSLDFKIASSQEYFIVFSNLDRLNLNQALYYSIDVISGQGAIEDSISNLVRVPAESYHAIKVTNQPAVNNRPVIVEAGFLDTNISSSEQGAFTAIAYVIDPDGLGEVQSVRLNYNGSFTGMYLLDDGTGGDDVAGDSLFTLKTLIEPGMPIGEHIVSMIAVDAAGLESVEWPYVEVKGSLDRSRSGLGVRLSQFEEREIRVNIRQALMKSNTDLGAPLILAGGFGFSDISSGSGGLLSIYAHVNSTSAETEIERVEAFLEGGIPLGMLLNDAGVEGDNSAGDGQYTFQSALAGGIPAGRYLVEIVAFDSAGGQSTTFPYLTVAE
ncbi:MAG: hypothetical protein JW941_11090, partial [Candidatus Coatesbacteria bacterium]|nr:hypothetical protein [Candidatus Coatesbacteria bacterium]